MKHSYILEGMVRHNTVIVIGSQQQKGRVLDIRIFWNLDRVEWSGE